MRRSVLGLHSRAPSVVPVATVVPIIPLGADGNSGNVRSSASCRRSAGSFCLWYIPALLIDPYCVILWILVVAKAWSIDFSLSALACLSPRHRKTASRSKESVSWHGTEKKLFRTGLSYRWEKPQSFLIPTGAPGLPRRAQEMPMPTIHSQLVNQPKG